MGSYCLTLLFTGPHCVKLALDGMSSYPDQIISAAPRWLRASSAPSCCWRGSRYWTREPITGSRPGIAVLAAIVAVFAWQAQQWWWLPLLAVIVVAWNPIWPIDFHHWIGWLIAQYVAAVVFLVIGVLVKVPNEDDKQSKA